MKYTTEYKNETTYYFFKIKNTYNKIKSNFNDSAEYFKTQMDEAYEFLHNELGNVEINNHCTFDNMELIILGVQDKKI